MSAPSAGSPGTASRGFTLIEVLVALVVVALGMSALLAMLNESASNISALRDKTVAEWIAMNQLALARLGHDAPNIGTTQGDVANCANGNWHWQQQVTAVDAIPGLLSITVSVQRTGDASPSSHPPPGSQSAATAGASSTPGATGQLGPNISLGPTAALGSVTTLSVTGCASVTAPDSSLGSSTPLGGPSSLGGPGSLGGPSSLGGASSLAGATSLESGSSSGSPLALSGTASSNTSSGPSSAKQSWLVTLTGFRGNSLSPPVGEIPSWCGSAFPGSAGTNGIPTGTPQNGTAESLNSSTSTTSQDCAASGAPTTTSPGVSLGGL